MFKSAIFIIFVIPSHAIVLLDWSQAMPFYRKLEVEFPEMHGKDVVILQNLLNRNESLSFKLNSTGIFDNATKTTLMWFQNKHELNVTGILNPATAKSVIENLLSDGYKDNGVIPQGYLFKIHVSVYRNRSIETNATLYNNNNEVIHKFKISTRGNTKQGIELNQLTTNGNTPTGLMTFDLNTPEPNESVYGPYPVLRCVEGLKGNAAISRMDEKDKPFISYYRSGILLHTGYWNGWESRMLLPNSNGCMHVSPTDMKKIVDILKKMGVKVNPNTFGKLPYPYKPQGVISIEQMD